VETDRIVQVVSIAITPRVVGDQALSRALALLATEDPAIRFRSDSATGRCTVAGVSDQHLEIIIDRLRLEFSIEAAVGPPSSLWWTLFALIPAIAAAIAGGAARRFIAARSHH